MTNFLHGGVTICFLAAGLFFFRFWRDTLDRLFLMFALSFWLQAVVRVSLAVVETEDRVFFYALRLLAYGLILAAIVMKNTELRDGHRH